MKPIGLGFQTVGHATLICYDDGPVLATDPWLQGTAAWGSWEMTHQVPDAQREAVQACRYLWISQDRGDHLHEESLDALSRDDRVVLLPDHLGRRMKDRIEAMGFETQSLADAHWVSLSDRLRVMSVSDVTLGAVLLVELGGRLLVNTNEAADHGAGALIMKAISEYEITYLLSAAGHEAPMVRTVDAAGEDCVTPPPPGPLGCGIETLMGLLGVTYFIPFSRMRRHRRQDSAWANGHMLPALAHHDGFWLEDKYVLPPFVHWDFETGGVSVLDPAENLGPACPSSEELDDWDEPLQGEEPLELSAYVSRVTQLGKLVDRVTVVVGGELHTMPLGQSTSRSLRIEAPRRSLVDAVRRQRLEEYLRAGFARVCLEGQWEWHDPRTLEPGVLTLLALAERGGACTSQEIREHVINYMGRGLCVPEAGGAQGRRLHDLLTHVVEGPPVAEGSGS